MARARWGHLELRTFVRGVCFFPRSKVVSRPLKPVTLVRFQLGEPHGGRGVLECTPRCERGGAGSIPVGHPASNNWAWVNGWPPGPEPGPRRFDSCRPDGSRTQARPRRWPRDGPAPGPRTGVQGCFASNPRRVRFPRGPQRRPCGRLGNVGAPSRRRTGFDSRQGHNVPLVHAATDAGLSIRRTGFDSPMGHRVESAAEWSATGPENRGGGDEPQRFDSSTLVRT